MCFYNFPHERKKVKYFPNDSYTGVFIRPRTVTKLRTLGQLRHRSVASLQSCSKTPRPKFGLAFEHDPVTGLRELKNLRNP